MLRLDCSTCHENIFEANNIAGIGKIPHRFTCSGCGAIYLVKRTRDRVLLAFRKGTSWKELFPMKIRET